jgi:hypothetical protein
MSMAEWRWFSGTRSMNAADHCWQFGLTGSVLAMMMQLTLNNRRKTG